MNKDTIPATATTLLSNILRELGNVIPTEVRKAGSPVTIVTSTDITCITLKKVGVFENSLETNSAKNLTIPLESCVAILIYFSIYDILL
jgi:hypothetical protein